MSITVKEALNLEIFKKAEIVAGSAGIDKKILQVDVLEVPDIAKWVRKNVLLMTTAFATKDNLEKLLEIVKILAEGGASALAIKTGRFIEDIPQEVLDEADSLKFPIIKLPLEVAYADIINILLSEILERQNNLIVLGDQLHQRLNKIVLIGGGLEGVVRTLHEVINKPVFIEDTVGNILAETASAEEILLFRKLIGFRNKAKKSYAPNSESASLVKSEEGKQIIAPIIADKKVYGWLTVLTLDEELEEFLFVAVERGVLAAALEIIKEKAVHEVELRLQREFIDDLLTTKSLQEDNIRARLKKFGFKYMEEIVVLTVVIDDFERNLVKNAERDMAQDLKAKILGLIKNAINNNKLSSIIINRNNEYIVFLGKNKESAHKKENDSDLLAEKIISYIKREFNFLNVVIGIGKTYNNVIDFKRSFEEAEQAIKIGRMVWKEKQIHCFHSLGIYNLLFSHPNQDLLKNFYKQYLNPLINYDSKHGTEFLRTLDIYHGCNKNAVAAAKKLYIHRNTLNYRLKKIKEILNLDIDDPEVGICLDISLKIKNVFDK